MEQVRSMNLPIVGRIQHGEQKISNERKKVVELGYFIAKIKNDNMQFLLNRFNEKYKQEKKLTIRFFDEDPLSVRRIRYNQAGAVCYCLSGQEQGKHKESNVWKPVNCSENCKYRLSADGISKPMCNEEATLKFLLPEISLDRIWIMKITGRKSIERLRTYISLQKQLGNSLIGDYTIFLSQEPQTNKLGKTFNNYYLDMVKIENSISNQQTPLSQNKFSTTQTQAVDNVPSNNIKNNNSIINSNNENQLETKVTKKETTKATKKTTQKSSKTTNEKQITKKEVKNENKTDIPVTSTEPNEDNYFILVDTSKKTLMKDGKPTEYTVGNFVDINDKPIDILIPPQLADELLKCDIGTSVTLDIAIAGNNTFTKNINYIQKLLKNVAA